MVALGTRYQIPGRPIFPAGGPDAAGATTALTNSVSAFDGPASDGSDGRWWQITPDQTGILILDVDLTYDDTGFQGGVLAGVGVYDDTMTLIANGSPAHADVTAGQTYLIQVQWFGTVYPFLRISDYGYLGEWEDSDNALVIAAPAPGMNYPAAEPAVELPPTEVIWTHASGPDTTSTVQLMDTGVMWGSSATMNHSPGTTPHPYDRDDNWRNTWEAASKGPSVDAFDNAPGDTSFDPFLDSEGHWQGSIAALLDWPIGYRADSSAIDATPPDGHQDISYTVWATSWQARLLRGSIQGTSHVVPWVNDEEPGTPPVDGATFEWEADASEPATILSADFRGTKRSDAAESAFVDGLKWLAAVYPMEWVGDGTFENGTWEENGGNPIPFGETPFPGITSSITVIDGEQDTGGGTAFFKWIADTGWQYPPGTDAGVFDRLGDWESLVAEADMPALLAHEATIIEMGDVRGGLIVNGIPQVIYQGDRGAALGLAETEDHFYTLHFPALRLTYARPRHRWRKDPLTPDAVAVGGIPPRRIFQRSDGLTHGARRVGGGNTRQSGSRTLGAIL